MFDFKKWREKAKIKREKALYEKSAASYRKAIAVTEILMFPDGDTYPCCPRCQMSLDREYMRYCDRCGQLLGWINFSDVESE